MGCSNPTSSKKEDTVRPMGTADKKQARHVKRDTMDKGFLLGKFDPAKNASFVKIDDSYADRPGLYMDKEAYNAFKKMFQEAKKDGISLIIRSATRNFDYQKGIWERKWTGKTPLSDGTNCTDIADTKARALKILRYSSMPGTSRHHWGTDIDLNAFNNDYFKSGKGKKEYEWLLNNAARFGYYRPYDDKAESHRSGYEEERWHWSYLPKSKTYTQSITSSITWKDINGFQGSETAKEIDVIRNYMLGIAHSCK